MPRYRRDLLLILPLLVVAAAFHQTWSDLYHRWFPPSAQVQVVDVNGAPIALTGEADVFAADHSLFQASPMACLGTIPLDGTLDPVEFSSDRFPPSIQVRFRVAGYGVDYVTLTAGRRNVRRLALGPPIGIEGQVKTTSGEPLADAQVIALGGGSRGVVLAETRSKADGSYQLDGLSQRVGFVLLRVCKDGFALVEREHWPGAAASEEESQTGFELAPVPPVHGLVEMPPGTTNTGLYITVLSYPGARADVASDGSFVLHGLVPNHRYRLLVQGLPDTLTQRTIQTQPGAHCKVEVVPAVTLRGRVLSTDLNRGLGEVEIWHQHTNQGSIERCLTDSTGAFELRRVPAGPVKLNLVLPDGHFGGGTRKRFVEASAEPTDIRVR